MLGSSVEEQVEIPFDVRPEEHGTRADVFVSRRLKRLSRAKAAAAIRAGMMRRPSGDRIEKPSTRLYGGERVLLARPKLVEAPTDDIALPVLYEDEALIAVNKPGDLIVHPTASAYRRTVIQILKSRRPGQFFDLAHRIDKETSGVLVLAKQHRASSRLKTDFAERRVKKSYLAIVTGEPEHDRFVVDAPMRLAPVSESGVLMEIGGPGAAAALTEVSVLSRAEGVALVEARPRTGRQHQIRLHLAHVGHPLVGDKLYLGGEPFFVSALRGGLEPAAVARQVGHWRHALHAHRISFRHPVEPRVTNISAPLPPDLAEIAELLGLDAP